MKQIAITGAVVAGFLLLKKCPEYRQQEFINSFGAALKDGKIQQIIYVPTEANIPIMESGKRTQVEVSK